jgi:hypothetical protein
VRKADTVPRPVLTKEEQAARLLAIKDKIKNRKAMKVSDCSLDHKITELQFSSYFSSTSEGYRPRHIVLTA